MRKGFREIIFMAIGLLVVLAVRLALYPVALQTDPVAYAAALHTRHIIGRGAEIEAISIGNSKGMAISFGTLGQRGYHAWIEGLTLPGLEYNLKSILPYMPNLRTAYIPANEFMFIAQYRSAYFRPEKTLLYNVTPSAGYCIPYDGDYVSMMAGRLWPLASSETIGKTLRHLARGDAPVPPEDAIDPDGLPLRYDRMPDGEDENYGAYYKSRMPYWLEYGRHDAIRRTTDALNGIITMLQSRGIRVVIYHPPSFPEFNAFMDDNYAELKSEYYGIMNRMTNARGVEFHDFSRDPEIGGDRANFLNHGHLSRHGAEIFSGKLLQAMRAADAGDNQSP